MAWVKIDDHIDEHPKIAAITDSALALFVASIAYCNRNLTNGFIPFAVGMGKLRYCDGNCKPFIQELEAMGLWEKKQNGWHVHDYLEYQSSKEQVLAEREAIRLQRSEAGKRSAEARRELYGTAQPNKPNEPPNEAFEKFPNGASNETSNGPRTPLEPEVRSKKEEVRKKNQESETLNVKNLAMGANDAPSPSRQTWNAYKSAYLAQYGTEPVRNAKVSGQIVQLVKRLGADTAPKVAAWFLKHRGSWYVKELHSVGVLLRDCEKLHTEWVTQTPLHARDVQEVDRISADQAMWKRIGERMEATNDTH